MNLKHLAKVIDCPLQSAFSLLFQLRLALEIQAAGELSVRVVTKVKIVELVGWKQYFSLSWS